MFAVGLQAPGLVIGREFKGPGQEGECGQVDLETNPAFTCDPQGMADQTEPGDVGGGMGLMAWAAGRTKPAKARWPAWRYGPDPPPPPPDVPALDGVIAESLPIRERLAKHREMAACASCHNLMDPVGFAMENFDVVGRWRTEDAGKPIDAKGELADGATFEGPDGLKGMLMARKDLFLRNLTRKMLGFALGRGLTLRDSCTVDEIVATVKAKNYASHALVEAIVLSTPFRYQAPTPKPEAAAKRRLGP